MGIIFGERPLEKKVERDVREDAAEAPREAVKAESAGQDAPSGDFALEQEPARPSRRRKRK